MGLLNHKIIVYCEINNMKYEQVRIVAVDPKLDWAGDKKGGGLKGEDLVWYLRERIIEDKIRVGDRDTGLIITLRNFNKRCC